MTIQVTVPTTATDRALKQIHAHSAKMQSLIEATKGRLNFPHGLTEQIRPPSVAISQGLTDTISSAKALADSISMLNQPTLDLSNRIRESVRETQAMMKRVEAITEPILVERRHFEQTLAELIQPIRAASLTARMSFPRSAVVFGNGPLRPGAPMVRVACKATRIVDCATERLRDRRRRDGDVRHRVELIVNLPNGEFLQVSKMSSTEDGLIRVIGADVDGFLRERFLAPEVIQYEIVTMKISRPVAQLTVVE
jgi:hypothetical protein